MLGLLVFVVGSIAGGLALDQPTLVSGRFAQGLGEAFAAPAALGLIVVLFVDPTERMKALGAWGAVSGLAGVLGTVLSGVLTDLASWRWVFFINVPIGLVGLVMVPRLVSESRMKRDRGQRLDVGGAVTLGGGLIAVVYGILQAATSSWGSAKVLVPLVAGVVLLGVMVLVERRSQSPLVPLSFFANRTRVTANVTSGLYAAAFFTFVFLLTLFEQEILGFSPMMGGLSFLPLGLGIGIGVGLSSALMPKVGIKPLLAVGYAGAAVGLFIISFIDVYSSYLTGVLPGMLIIAVFAGLTLPTGQNAAMHEATGQDSGLASGVQNTMLQIGGGLGLAVLVTLAIRHFNSAVNNGLPSAVAATEGYALAFRVAAGVVLLSAVLVLAFLRQEKPEPNPRVNSAGR
jgi:MFS family permease